MHEAMLVEVPSFMYRDVYNEFLPKFRKAGRKIEINWSLMKAPVFYSGEFIQMKQMSIFTKNCDVNVDMINDVCKIVDMNFKNYYELKQIVSASKKLFANRGEYISKQNATNSQKSSAESVKEILMSGEYILIDNDQFEEYCTYVLEKSKFDDIFAKAVVDVKGAESSKLRQDRISIAVWSSFKFLESIDETLKPVYNHRAIGEVKQRFRDVEVKCKSSSNVLTRCAFTGRPQTKFYYEFIGPDGSHIEYSGAADINVKAEDIVTLDFTLKHAKCIKGVMHNYITRMKVKNNEP